MWVDFDREKGRQAGNGLSLNHARTGESCLVHARPIHHFLVRTSRLVGLTFAFCGWELKRERKYSEVVARRESEYPGTHISIYSLAERGRIQTIRATTLYLFVTSRAK